MNLDVAHDVLQELVRRHKQLDLVDRNFAKQAAFIEDTSRLSAAFCTRRAGKSYGVGLKLCNTSMLYPGDSSLYIGLTRDSCKRIMFKDVISQINHKHSLGAKPNLAELSWTFPGGAVQYYLGMDSTPQEAAKALGQKYRYVVIDEAQSFRRNLYDLVYKVLRPATADLKGRIDLTGTPDDMLAGLFYDVVWQRKVGGWSIHTWTAHDNPYMALKWQEEIDLLVAENPRVVELPWFRQQYLGEYVIDDENKVYKYNADRNLIAPERVPELVSTVLGVDLGWTDDTAFVAVGYRHDDKKLYVVEAQKQPQLTITAVAERIEYYQRKYNPYKIIIDGANTQAVEELRQRFGLPLETADKRGKVDFIDIMNAEYLTGNIMIADGPLTQPLRDEYAKLIWDKRALETRRKREEHPACANHAADSLLYAWRYCYQYASEIPEPKPDVDEMMDLWADMQAQKMEDDRNQPWWERDAG